MFYSPGSPGFIGALASLGAFFGAQGAWAVSQPSPTPVAAPVTIPVTKIDGQNLTATTEPVHIDLRDGATMTVVVFLSARCPCSMSHEPTLSALAREYGNEARFVAIHSNADEPAQESADHFRNAALPFPVVQDTNSHFANAFGAVKTPHAFLLAKDGHVLFEGGVDDSHDAKRARRAYLKDALEDVRGGRSPKITLARSIGCQIRR